MANIFQQFLQPVRSVSDYTADLDKRDLMALQLEGARGQNALTQLTRQQQMEQARQQGITRNALTALLNDPQFAGNPAGLEDAMLKDPRLFDQGSQRRAARLDAENKAADVRKKTSETDAAARLRNMQFMLSLNTPDLFVQSLDADKTISPEQKAAIKAAMPTDPAAFHQFRIGLALSQATPEQQAAGLMPKYQDTGGQLTNINPIAPGAPVRKTATPADVMANDRSLKQDRLPTFDPTNGVWVDRARQTITQAIGPDGKPFPGRTVAASEDERKAAGWLAQATNAWNNMRTVAFDANGNITDAARPGFNDALAAIPSMGLTSSIANKMRGADRQKFIQASSSLSEALLRAATGAGVNESEARQKVQELTPVFGEAEETTKQKMEAIPMYLDALKSRAGRAAPPGYVPPGVPQGQSAPPFQMPADPNARALFERADAIIGGK